MEIIGLTGLNASGKGTVADFLKEKGYTYYSLSDIVREEAAALGLDYSRENLIYAGNKLRDEHGASILAKRIVEKINLQKPDLAVIDSIRNLAEINGLKKMQGFFLIGVDAPVEIRFERAKKRGRIGFEKTLKDFIEIEEKENSADTNKQQLFECLKKADAVIQNNGTMGDLNKKLDDILWEGIGCRVI